MKYRIIDIFSNYKHYAYLHNSHLILSHFIDKCQQHHTSFSIWGLYGMLASKARSSLKNDNFLRVSQKNEFILYIHIHTYTHTYTNTSSIPIACHFSVLKCFVIYICFVCDVVVVVDCWRLWFFLNMASNITQSASFHLYIFTQ